MEAELTRKIINLMQFARKDGKLIAGTDACLREHNSRGLRLIVIASDTAEPVSYTHLTLPTIYSL